MWWFWPKFLSESNTVLQFLPLGCIYLHLTDMTWCCLTHHFDQHSIFCYFPWIVRSNFRWPSHGIVAVSSDSSFGCKLPLISIENSLTQAIFWIASLHLVLPGLFCHLSCPFHYSLPLFVLVSLSLVKAKGHITIVHMEELWGCHCHYPKFQFHNHQTSKYGPAYNLHKI